MPDEIKISYSSAQKRVRIELTRAACLSGELAPSDLITRARNKLEEIKYLGEIDFFVCYESRLQECWKAVSALPASEGDRRFIITIGAGCPILPGIKAEKGQGKVLAYLSINVPKTTCQSWRYEWFRLFFLKKLREIGITELPTNAQLYAAFARMRQGERIERMAIGANSALASMASQKAFSILANKQRQEIALIIRNPNEIHNPEIRREALRLIQEAVNQLSQFGTKFIFFKRDLLLALRSAYEGPEALGIELPLVLLVAVGNTPLVAGINSLSALNYPGCGKLNFEVSSDKMTAKIGSFHMEFFDSAVFKVNMEWIIKEMQRNRILIDPDPTIASEINTAIANRQNLEGMICARGIEPVGAKQPFLANVFQDLSIRSGKTLDLNNSQLDMREMQQRKIVNAGSVVATIRFNEPGIPGRTVLGEDIPPSYEDLTVDLGDGLQRRGLDIVAMVDGLPQIEGNKITFTQGLVHAGDVNLRSGNIHFAGPVEIQGSIESGAIVEAGGDLIVNGQIQGAIVRVKGNLIVKAGIVTGQTGFVQVSGNLLAEFVEQSEILCNGDMTVTKALINSRVFVGRSLKISSKGGVCAGGDISCKNTLDCGNLGFKNGAPTAIHLGIDGRLARRILIRSKRREKVETKLTEDRNALRELSGRKSEQMTSKHKELKKTLNDRLQRGRTLLETMSKHIEKAQAQLSFDPNARVFVRETLHTNVQVEISGTNIPIVDTVAGVCIVPKKIKDSHFLAIEDVESKPDASANADDKAQLEQPRKAS